MAHQASARFFVGSGKSPIGIGRTSTLRRKRVWNRSAMNLWIGMISSGDASNKSQYKIAPRSPDWPSVNCKAEISMTLQQILTALENIAPLDGAEKWDNVGLLAGDP